MFSGTLSDTAQDALALLGESGLLSSSYLAGGSSLALQLGHRLSVDFDFFSQEKFDALEIKRKLERLGEYKSDELTKNTLLGIFEGVSFSLFHYPYKLIRPTQKFAKIDLAGPEDIAAMKLVAISDRSPKKDFIDIYFLAKEKFSIETMFGFYDQKYGVLTENRFTLLKGLQYFEEAEISEMPVMLKPVDWDKVKQFFRDEVVRLWKIRL